jgi:hypothetical protein
VGIGTALGAILIATDVAGWTSLPSRLRVGQFARTLRAHRFG